MLPVLQGIEVSEQSVTRSDFTGEGATITEINDGDGDKPDIEIDADHQDESDDDDDTGIVFIRFGKRASGTAEEPSIVEGL